MRVVCYAVNGSGIGHLKRLSAIARHLRRIAQEKAVPLEIYFLTSSEASHLLFSEGFPVFKMPSREVLTKAGIETKDFAAIARNWTARTFELLQPDLLIVDTFPAGYYDELIESLPLCRATAVIHRPLVFDHLDRTQFYEALARYDLIIVPESREAVDEAVPFEIRGKTKYFGAVMCREKEELFDCNAARRILNVDDGEFLIYLSAGGGGDKKAEARIHHLYDILSKIERTKIVVGAGALYGGQRIYAENVIWLAGENAFELMPAFDAAVSAAGYNSFHELLFAGVPTVFIPQEKWADDQFKRAHRAAQAGAAVLFDQMPETNQLTKLIECWRNDSDLRRTISQNAQKFVPANYALPIARYLFENTLSV